MTYDTGELKAAWEIEAAAKRDEDKRDYDRELAGIDIGRTARFHTAEFVEDRREGRAGAAQSQRSSHQQYASRLQMLLATNAAYARLYGDTMDTLGDAEAATDRAIAKAQAAWQEAQNQREQTLTRAAKLPDGTRVFRDARGHVWNERGERLSEADAARIEWRGDEPAYEQFLQESESVRDRLTRLEALQGFRIDTLGRFRDRMDDPDNPPTTEEIQQHSRDMQAKMPEAVKEELHRTTASIAPTPSADIAAPVREL